MPIKPILTIPNPILDSPAEKVGVFDDMTKHVIADLLDTVLAAKDPEGAGLAAPQIGVAKRICVVRKFIETPDLKPGSPDKLITKEYILVNPKIISASKETDIHYEGCLSIPDVYGQVERSKKIKVKALDENGQPIRISASGFFARIIQHEIDHLDGILFTTKLVSDPITESEFDQLIDEEDKLA